MWAIGEARRASADPARPPRVVLANRAQIRQWRQRVAAQGGALGLQLLTFDDLHVEILQAAGEHPVRLPDPVQVRLMRALLDATPLVYFAALRLSPSLPGMLRDLWTELSAAGIDPDSFTAYCARQPERMQDLAQLYAAYRMRMEDENWVDRATLGTLAVRALQAHTTIGSDWPLLLLDGIDDLTTVELQVLALLAARVERISVFLTGDAEGEKRASSHRRASVTRDCLERALAVRAEALPEREGDGCRALALRHLERTLHRGERDTCAPGDAVSMIAVPDREAEVRTALRWLKRRLVIGDLSPGQAALLARNMQPYHASLAQVASEYGLPLSWASRTPLRENPAVASLVDLLRLVFPVDGEPGSAFPWRGTVDAWRNPYFDWAACGIEPQDADGLEWAARWGNVVAGRDQWQEAFAALITIDPEGTTEDGEPVNLPSALPCGDAAEQLQRAFERFVALITPPGTADHEPLRCQEYVRWLEELVGDTEGLLPGADVADEPPDDDATVERASSGGVVCLGIARRAAMPGAAADARLAREQARIASRDIAALNAFKDVLRGLVWAEQALHLPPQTAAQFVDDLLGAVEAATYTEPLPEGESGIFVGTVSQARGLTFEAVALLGLAEGEFPATLREDTLLRDGERRALNENLASDLRLRTESEESELFYQAVTRAQTALLLTRPRIADDGALWKPSPFWEQVLRHVEIEPLRLTTRDRPAADQAGSWPELWQALTPHSSATAVDLRAWAATQRSAEARAIGAGSAVLQARLTHRDTTPGLDGDLSRWAPAWTARLGARYRWSVSQLEAYRRCPYSYLAEKVLRLEPRRAPAEGLDARQRGTLYHRILATVYHQAGAGASLDDLLNCLEEIAGPILDEAPRREGFRVTPWWERTRVAMLRSLRRTLVALETFDARFQFRLAEQGFGRRQDASDPLVVEDGASDTFLLTGVIDRVDAATDGSLRIVDYKSGNVTAHSAAALMRGDDLQIALYALAAEGLLAEGQVVEGFYWSVAQAKASPLQLSKFALEETAGPQAASQVAVTRAWEAVRAARAGLFVPSPPADGCPSYCPASAYCWRYQEARW